MPVCRPGALHNRAPTQDRAGDHIRNSCRGAPRWHVPCRGVSGVLCPDWSYGRVSLGQRVRIWVSVWVRLLGLGLAWLLWSSVMGLPQGPYILEALSGRVGAEGVHPVGAAVCKVAVDGDQLDVDRVTWQTASGVGVGAWRDEAAEQPVRAYGEGQAEVEDIGGAGGLAVKAQVGLWRPDQAGAAVAQVSELDRVCAVTWMTTVAGEGRGERGKV